VTETALADALVWLDSHINLEAMVAGTRAAVPTLERVRAALALMADPQSAYPVLQVTGTNGKGSAARMMTRLLVARGLSVGTYTSPDLERINERLAWNSDPIDDASLADVLLALADLEPMLDERLTRFEILTAAAYRWFADIAVDAAVVEVGMGGLWDATSAADADVAVVTNVSLDHVELLGPTLEHIATEKAGIVKPGSTLILGETDPGLAAIFRRAGAAEVWERDRDFALVRNDVAHGGRLLSMRTPEGSYDDVYLPVHGAHQGDNAVAALAAAEAFFGAPLAEEVVTEAFASVRTPGRMEVMARDPLVILDGAHNAAGARSAAATLSAEFSAVTGRILVVGVLGGRDPSEMLSALGAGAARRVIACAPPSPRAVPAEVVAEAARAMGIEGEVAS
jgi:dihydrofolate synthase/folylpolyglutamate synthase